MAWSADQYLKFEDERTRPARDLLAQVSLDTINNGYDLGCGPGNSTELMTTRFGTDVISGVDSDEDMLEKAKQRLPLVRFDRADLGTWAPEEPADLLFANAVFQWLPNHLDIMVKLMGHLKPNGILAVQMPDNLDEPSHLMMEETGQSGIWAQAFEGGKLRRKRLPAEAAYFNALRPLSASVDIWRTTYYHPMDSAGAIVEWVKGTGLRPYLDAAGESNREAFLHDYTQRIDQAYQPLSNGQRLLAFPRLFIVAKKAASD
jgi:trans-aconitate 2-methyltransferase